MMHQEFEELAGYEVSAKDYYDISEPMYMATNLSKQEFVKVIDKKRFALRPAKAIVKEMKKVAEHLQDTCTHYTDFEAKEKLESLVNEYIERKGWKGFATYGIHEEMRWSCFYPKSVEIFEAKNYRTIESIELV